MEKRVLAQNASKQDGTKIILSNYSTFNALTLCRDRTSEQEIKILLFPRAGNI
jgi:hypothetical protein